MGFLYPCVPYAELSLFKAEVVFCLQLGTTMSMSLIVGWNENEYGYFLTHVCVFH